MSRRARHTGANALLAYLEAIDDTPLLSPDRERELASRVAAGDIEARDHMVRANLRLVVNIARGYRDRGLGLEDLVAEGNLGLVRAVEGFDPDAGTRFSTYAAYWVKQSIRAALMKQGKVVRLPAYMHTLLSKWRRAARTLAERLGREPTAEEIGGALRLSRRRLGMVIAALEADAAATKREGPDAEGADPTREVADGRSASAEERVAEAELYGLLAERLGRLGDREYEVVRLRYGLGGEPPMALQAVGDRLGMTRERVRQLERQALAGLAAPVGGPAEPAFA